jgi:hypothetical protein
LLDGPGDALEGAGAVAAGTLETDAWWVSVWRASRAPTEAATIAATALMATTRSFDGPCFAAGAPATGGIVADGR